MYKEYSVAVVVPAYNEEKLIGRVLETMPAFVDHIIVVNDASRDATRRIVTEFQAAHPKVVLIDHDRNRGLGQSLIDGYVKAREMEAGITAVMAGDAQMDPADLPKLLEKIAGDGFDYVKGNRLLHLELKSTMPAYRIIGNAILTILTKFATGYFFLMDPQCGYTAIHRRALAKIPIEQMVKGYGYNADILCMLHIIGCRVTDVEVRPVYGEAVSHIRLWRYIPKVSCLLVSLFFRRMVKRYLVRDFHPLICFYAMAFILLPLGLWKGWLIVYMENIQGVKVTEAALIFAVLLIISGLQSLFFAIWFDSEYARKY